MKSWFSIVNKQFKTNEISWKKQIQNPDKVLSMMNWLSDIRSSVLLLQHSNCCSLFCLKEINQNSEFEFKCTRIIKKIKAFHLNPMFWQMNFFSASCRSQSIGLSSVAYLNKETIPIFLHLSLFVQKNETFCQMFWN